MPPNHPLAPLWLQILVVVVYGTLCLVIFVFNYRVYIRRKVQLRRLLHHTRRDVWVQAQCLLLDTAAHYETPIPTSTFTTLLAIQRISIREVVDLDALMTELRMAFTTRQIVPEWVGEGRAWHADFSTILTTMARGLYLIAICEQREHWTSLIRAGWPPSPSKALAIAYDERKIKRAPSARAAWQYWTLMHSAEQFMELARTDSTKAS